MSDFPIPTAAPHAATAPAPASLAKAPLRRLLALALSARWQIALAVLLGAATIGSGVGLMATSAYLISLAALHPSIAALAVAIVGVRFFGVARGVFRYCERLVSHSVTFRLLARLRVWFYDALEPLAPARLMGYRGGDLLTRIVADIETLQHFYVRVLAPPAVAVVATAGMWIFFARYDLALANMLLLFLLLGGVGVPLLSDALARETGRRLVIARAELTVQALDGVQGMAELVAFGQAARHQRRLEQLSHETVTLQARLARLAALTTALLTILTSTAQVAVLYLAIPLISSGRLPAVLLAALALAAAASFEAVAPLPQALQQLGTARETARRLFAIVDAAPAVPTAALSDSAPPPADAALVVAGLRFRYAPDEPWALGGVDFSVRPGALTAVVGASGAGKSSLANVLLRLWDYDAGQVLLGRRDLRSYAPDDVRRAIAVLPQQVHLFNGTIRQNLLLARPEAREDEIADALRRARLADLVASLPAGLETEVGERGLLLSGGERQRLALARAILKDAPILVLDEPTANLDAATERAVMETVAELARTHAVLLITHRLAGLRAAREIIVLEGGRVVERGAEHELLAHAGAYRRYWRLQHEALAALALVGDR